VWHFQRGRKADEMGFAGKARDYLHPGYQPGERKLLQKIDFFILTFCCLSYFMNYVSC
jgi:hypothetical protein